MNMKTIYIIRIAGNLLKRLPWGLKPSTPGFIKNQRQVTPSGVAHIGLGGMGNNHMNWFQALPGVEIVRSV